MNLNGKLSGNNGVWTIDPLQDDRWPQLTDRHPNASVFHTRGWLNALQMTYGYEPVAFTTCGSNDPLTNAVLFCVVRSRLTGARIVSLPFSDHCEPLVENREELSKICMYAEKLREQEGLKYVEIRSANPVFEFGQDFRAAHTYALHRLDLCPALDVLRKRFHKDCVQRRIARAEREPLRYEYGHSSQLVDQLYRLLQLTRGRHKLPVQPADWFRNVVACLGKDVCIRIASMNDRPIAGIVTVSHGRTLVYKYGGSDAQFNHIGATPFLFWQAIKEAKNAGVEIFDLGRSDLENPGLIIFKERWSATRSTLNNWRSPAGQRVASDGNYSMQLVKTICGWMPNRVLKLVGRLLYRHIG